MDYTSISSREQRLLEEIAQRGLTVFTPIDASNILQESRENTYRILSRMKHKNIIVRLEKGKYIRTKDIEESHPYGIACRIVEPSYLSLWSALHYYGYTTQVPRIIYLMVTMSKPSLILQKQPVQFVRTKHFFGYKNEGDVIIAEPEKLFLDCLQFPDYAGGVEEIKAALRNAEIDGKKIIGYALKINNKSLNSRLGYLLQSTNKNFESTLLKNNGSKTPVPLDPSLPREGTVDDTWMIINNVR